MIDAVAVKNAKDKGMTERNLEFEIWSLRALLMLKDVEAF
jgi:hypothetical protein